MRGTSSHGWPASPAARSIRRCPNLTGGWRSCREPMPGAVQSPARGRVAASHLETLRTCGTSRRVPIEDTVEPRAPLRRQFRLQPPACGGTLGDLIQNLPAERPTFRPVDPLTGPNPPESDPNRPVSEDRPVPYSDPHLRMALLAARRAQRAYRLRRRAPSTSPARASRPPAGLVDPIPVRRPPATSSSQ